MSAFKLPCKQITEPPLKQGYNASQKEVPDPPRRCPKANTGSFTNLPGIKPVVNQVFQIFGHAYLAHQAVLVPVHASQMADMRKCVLEPISQLERIDLAKSILNVLIHHQLQQP